MRTVVALVSLTLLAGCGAGSGGTAPSSASAATTPVSNGPSATESPVASASPTAAAGGPCSLVTAAEVTRVAGDEAAEPRVTALAGNPVCQWATAGGRVLQVVSQPGSDWAAALPQAIDIVTRSGAADPEDLARLRKASAVIEAGGKVGDAEACGLFSTLLVIGGQPAGSDRSIRVFPSAKDAKSLSVQLCSRGRFTSVSLLSSTGLTAPLPVDELSALATTVHARSLG